MTTPPEPPASGAEREAQAAAAGAEAAAAIAEATAAIIAVMAATIAAVASGAMGVAAARRRVRGAISAALGGASRKLKGILARMARQAAAGGEAAGKPNKPEPAGKAKSKSGSKAQIPGLPPVPDAPKAIAEAILTAQQDAGKAFEAAMYAALGGKGGPLRPAPGPYRDVVEKAMRRLTGIGEDVKNLTGAERAKQSLSRLQAAQVVMNELAGRGLTGFTDSAGRRWELGAYAEMATRTASSRMHLASQLSMMAQAGSRLVIVDNPSKEAPCPLCRPYEGKVLALHGDGSGESMITDASGTKRTEKIAGTLEEAVAKGLLHPNCFPADVLVSAPSGVRAADSRWYEGDLVVIHTAGGDELPVTPNHPVLTPEGWVAAGALKVGQRVVRYGSRDERVDAMGASLRPGDEQIPARIGEVFDALRKASPVPAVRVPAAAEQFHGDGGHADVDVVLADRLLEDDRNGQRIGDGALAGSGPGLRPLLADGSLLKFGERALGTADSVMGGARQSPAPCGAHARMAAAHGLAESDLTTSRGDVSAETALPNAQVGRDDALILAGLIPADGFADLVGSQAALADDAGRLDLPHDGGRADAEDGTDLLNRLAGLVTLDHVVSLGSRQVATHVYNLQSGDGWYVASGIVVHNCRHSLIPWTDGAGAVATAGGKERGYVEGGKPVSKALPIGTPQDYKNEQRLRAHERAVRRDHARLSAALTPQAKARAKLHLAASRQALEGHVKRTGVTRLPHREKAGKAR